MRLPTLRIAIRISENSAYKSLSFPDRSERVFEDSAGLDLNRGISELLRHLPHLVEVSVRLQTSLPASLVELDRLDQQSNSRLFSFAWKLCELTSGLRCAKHRRRSLGRQPPERLALQLLPKHLARIERQRRYQKRIFSTLHLHFSPRDTKMISLPHSLFVLKLYCQNRRIP